jgi:hypothetical protein
VHRVGSSSVPLNVETRRVSGGVVVMLLPQADSSAPRVRAMAMRCVIVWSPVALNVLKRYRSYERDGVAGVSGRTGSTPPPRLDRHMIDR